MSTVTRDTPYEKSIRVPFTLKKPSSKKDYYKDLKPPHHIYIGEEPFKKVMKNYAVAHQDLKQRHSDAITSQVLLYRGDPTFGNIFNTAQGTRDDQFLQSLLDFDAKDKDVGAAVIDRLSRLRPGERIPSILLERLNLRALIRGLLSRIASPRAAEAIAAGIESDVDDLDDDDERERIIERAPAVAKEMVDRVGELPADQQAAVRGKIEEDPQRVKEDLLDAAKKDVSDSDEGGEAGESGDSGDGPKDSDEGYFSAPSLPATPSFDRKDPGRRSELDAAIEDFEGLFGRDVVSSDPSSPESPPSSETKPITELILDHMGDEDEDKLIRNWMNAEKIPAVVATEADLELILEGHTSSDERFLSEESINYIVKQAWEILHIIARGVVLERDISTSKAVKKRFNKLVKVYNKLSDYWNKAFKRLSENNKDKAVIHTSDIYYTYIGVIEAMEESGRFEVEGHFEELFPKLKVKKKGRPASQTGEGIIYYKHPQELLNKLRVLMGLVDAKNDNKEVRNQIAAILDELKKSKGVKLDNKIYKKIYQQYVLSS